MSTENTTPEIGKSVFAGGIQTNYHEYGQSGQGDPVILIHGSGPGVSAWSNWRLALPYLGEKLHVFAYDQVGFGYSELPARPAQPVYNLEVWTNHLLSFMDALGLERVSLIGNSMGASVALAVAVTHPQRINRLILMGAMGVRFPLEPGTGIDAVWGYTPSVANMKKLIDLFAYNRALVTDELAEMRYRASIRPGLQEAFSSMFPAPRQHGINDLARYEEQLSGIQAPTMIFHGREDRVIPLENSWRLLQTLPNAELHVFGHCGHWTQIEHEASFNRISRDFLSVKE